MATTIRAGDCLQIPDGRVRDMIGQKYRVRVRRRTSATHQFLMFRVKDLKRIDCPKGWMSPEGYMRYLKVTLEKMQQRQRQGKQPNPRASLK